MDLKPNQKVYLGLFIAIIVFALIGLNLVNSSPFLGNKTAHEDAAPIPMHKSVNISSTINSPRGTISVDLHVPESPAIMPFYRLNMTDRTDIRVDRTMGAAPRIYRDNASDHIEFKTLLPEDTEIPRFSEKILQQFGGLPSDASVEKVEKYEGLTVYHPNYTVPYSVIIYNRTLRGTPVESWQSLENDNLELKIGLNGELVELEESWTKSEFIEDVPVISVEEALEKIRQGKDVKYDIMGSWDANITKIRQGYFESSYYLPEIEPVWIFYGTTKEGWQETIFVLARQNVSVSSTSKKQTIMEQSNKNVEQKEKTDEDRNISVTQAINVAKTFSKNPDFAVLDYQIVNERDGCHGTLAVYNLTTSDGVYRINAKNAELISVNYNKTAHIPIKTPLEYYQVLEISREFIQEKFGNFSRDRLLSKLFINEQSGHYQLIVPFSGTTSRLTIDKQTGEIIEYSDCNAEPSQCFCWGDGSCYSAPKLK